MTTQSTLNKCDIIIVCGNFIHTYAVMSGYNLVAGVLL